MPSRRRDGDASAGAGHWLDRAIAVVAPGMALKRAAARFRLEASARYKAADITRLRHDWLLPGQADGADASAWDLAAMRERARDANRNDPIAAGATDTLRTNIVGQGLRPQSRIRADRLGISDARAKALQRQAEDAYERWKPHADAANRLDFDDLQFLALTKIVEDGEAITIPTWATEPWRPYGRCLEIIESERLTSDYGADGYKNGIKFGRRGEPLKYRFDRAAGDDRKPITIDARDGRGRPKVIHVFRQNRPGQTRGVPLFAPVLGYFKDMADYLEAEVVAARVAACLAVFVTKQDPMNGAFNMSDDTESTTSARIQGIEPGMVGYLGIGESINVVDPRRPGDAFPAFVETMFRLIGVALGLPYELLVKDFTKGSFSAVNAALLEGRRMFKNWRAWFARGFCQPVWELLLEEAYLRGEFDAPDFYRFRHEYCRAWWLGGAWGWVDPVKEVEAKRKKIDYGFSTLAKEAGDEGMDWEDVIDQRVREIPREKEAGVTAAAPAKGPAAGGGDGGSDEG